MTQHQIMIREIIKRLSASLEPQNEARAAKQAKVPSKAERDFFDEVEKKYGLRCLQVEGIPEQAKAETLLDRKAKADHLAKQGIKEAKAMVDFQGKLVPMKIEIKL